MRRLLPTAALLAACACASPAPCTQALCPIRFEGSYRVSGWTGSVTVTPGTPPVPIVSDSTVEILSGRAEFGNRKAVVRAEEGSSFSFEVSTSSARVPIITVAKGPVSVALSSGAALAPVPLGAPYPLPVK